MPVTGIEPGEGRLANEKVVAVKKALELRMPSVEDLNRAGPDTRNDVRHPAYEIEDVLEKGARENPGVIVLELDDVDAAGGEELARPAKDGKVMALGVDLDELSTLDGALPDEVCQCDRFDVDDSGCIELVRD